MPRLLDALNLATRLIEPDPSDPLRAGYSIENAALAAADHYQLGTVDRLALRRMLDARYA